MKAKVSPSRNKYVAFTLQEAGTQDDESDRKVSTMPSSSKATQPRPVTQSTPVVYRQRTVSLDLKRPNAESADRTARVPQPAGTQDDDKSGRKMSTMPSSSKATQPRPVTQSTPVVHRQRMVSPDPKRPNAESADRTAKVRPEYKYNRTASRSARIAGRDHKGMHSKIIQIYSRKLVLAVSCDNPS
jgi:hypothetical protein